MEGVLVSGCDLRGIELAGGSLVGASVVGCRMEGAEIRGVTGVPVVLDGSRIVSGSGGLSFPDVEPWIRCVRVLGRGQVTFAGTIVNESEMGQFGVMGGRVA